MHTTPQLLPEGEQEQSSGNELVVGVIQINQVACRANQDLLNLCGGDSIIELDARIDFNLRGRHTREVLTCLVHHLVHLIEVKTLSLSRPLTNFSPVCHLRS